MRQFLLYNMSPVDKHVVLNTEPADVTFKGPANAVSVANDQKFLGLGFKPRTFSNKKQVSAQVGIKGLMAIEVSGEVLPYSIPPNKLVEFFTEFSNLGVKATVKDISDGDEVYTFELENTGISIRDIRIVLLDTNGKFVLKDFESLNNYQTVVGIRLDSTTIPEQERLVSDAGILQLSGTGPYTVFNGIENKVFFEEIDLIDYLKINGYNVSIVNDSGVE